MKRSTFLGMKALLVSAAAILCVTSFSGCMSTSDSADPAATEATASADATATEATATEANAASTDEKAPTDATADTPQNVSNSANAENGTAAPAENAAGGELQNLVNDGSSSAATDTPKSASGEETKAGVDPFAPVNNEAPVANSNGFALNSGEGGGAAPVANAAAPAADAAAPVANADAPAADAAVPAANAAVPAADTAVATNAAAPAPEASAEVSSGGGDGVLPEMGTKMPYYIRSGDTLASIATKIYGDKSKWKTLVEENTIKNPSLIYAGDVIQYTLNEKSSAFASKYSSASRQVITVKQGDTLSSIAEKVLGNAAEWRTLWKNNPQVKNPDVISVGATLTYFDVAGVADVNYEEPVMVASLNE